MITITRRQARRLRAVFRRHTLGITHKGLVPPLVFGADPDCGLRVRHHQAALAVEHVLTGPYRPEGTIGLPLDALAAFGGFEIAMMTGAYLAAAEAKMTILVDGFIASSALLVAHALAPALLDYCVFAHLSNETGHRRLLDAFDAKPLLALDMRLGEGTGAALALPLLRAAVAFLNEMASFESAGVAGRDEGGELAESEQSSERRDGRGAS